MASLASTSRQCLSSSAQMARPSIITCSRHLTTTRVARRDEADDNPFNRPAPPPLPPKEQREFEALVKEKANSLQFNATKGDEVVHPQFRAKPKADFEGDINPETGEVGGPKKDPLKNWQNEWTYGGRTYDF